MLTYQRGETIAVFLEAIDPEDGALDGITVSASVKKSPYGTAAEATAPVVATFDVAVNEPGGDVLPGWTLTIEAADSADLTRGKYVTNAALTFPGGAVQKTDPLFFSIEESTS